MGYLLQLIETKSPIVTNEKSASFCGVRRFFISMPDVPGSRYSIARYFKDCSGCVRSCTKYAPVLLLAQDRSQQLNST